MRILLFKVLQGFFVFKLSYQVAPSVLSIEFPMVRVLKIQ